MFSYKIRTEKNTFNVFHYDLGYFLNETLNNQNFAFEFGIYNYQKENLLILMERLYITL